MAIISTKISVGGIFADMDGHCCTHKLQTALVINRKPTLYWNHSFSVVQVGRGSQNPVHP